MTRSSSEMNQKITTLEMENRRLTYNLSEVIGTVEEYLALPCESLRVRMKQAVEKAK